MGDERSSSSRSLNEPSVTGLSVLVEPERPTLDIVFVHGFTGHPVRTWSHKTEYVTRDRDEHYTDGCERPAKIPRLSCMTSPFRKAADREKVYWPRHLLPETLPTARVLVYGYDSKIGHSLGTPISQNTVYDIASDLLKSLEANRRSQPSRPLVFVAHSLGGIIGKEALRQAHGCETHHHHLRQIYESTAAIVFFGTPHGGADPRGLRENVIERIARAAGVSVNEQIVNALLPTSERLKELRDSFAPMARHKNWIIYSFQEQYDVRFLSGGKVVDDVSSSLGDPSLETTQHISSDHMDMCRFSGSDDVEYRKVAAALDHIQANIMKESANPVLHGLGAAFVPEPSSPLSESHRRALTDSLWHHTIDTRYATIKSAHARTCEWLLKKTEYQDWLDINKTQNHHGVLWIKGKPGSGKSTLVKFAVANARKTRAKTAVISFFFNARGEDLEKSTLGMYRSLLYQILNTFPYLQTVLDCLRPTVPREGETYRWEKDDLQNLFAAAVENLGQRRLICFIDALDECEEDQIRDLVAFLEHLGRLATSSGIHFYVCLSSRHYPHISIENGVEMILEDQEDHTQDITKYLNGTLRAGRGKQTEQIKEELLRRSSGVFLWVVLVVHILNKEYDHGRIHGLRKRLGELPDGLEKLFEEILTRDQQNTEELILCLQWILYAKHPLRQEEVYYAILSGTDPEVLISTTSEEITTQDMERFILSCSKGLAETTRLKARTVQFIHESVREFLLGKNGFNKLRLELGCGLSHDRLKQCCYNYMMVDTSAFLPSNRELPAASSEEAKDLRKSISQKWPFLEYAVHNMLYHADVADGQGVSQKAFVEKFAIGKWILLDNLFEKFQIRRHTTRASLLYILAEKDFSNLIRTQLELELDPNTALERYEKERYVTPLSAALASTPINENTIQALLAPNFKSSYDHGELHNAQCDCECECGRAAVRIIAEKRPSLSPRKGQTLMHWAASDGHDAVVDLLLSKKDVDPDPKDSYNQTPLSLAASGGHETVVNLLFSKGADPDSKDKTSRSPLSWAAENGHETIVNQLLSRGADPDFKDISDRTPLSLAAERGHETIVNQLLSRGADPDSKDYRGQSPLSYAAEKGYEIIVDQLLSKAADPDCKDNSNETPLSYAAQNGHATIVSLLLSKGVDLDSQDGWGERPLLYAVFRGHHTVVNLLLSKGVDPDSKGNLKKSPLYHAVSGGHHTVVNLLLSNGADLNSKDCNDRTPLSRAAEKGHETIVDLLLSKGVDPDSKDINYRTPLSYAASEGHVTIGNLLLSKGAEVDSEDRADWTPLFYAARFGREEMVDLLISKGAYPNAKDSDNWTPLIHAVRNNNGTVVRLLLAHPDIKVEEKRTALLHAASVRHGTMVDLLLSKGDGLSKKDGSDWTYLFHAVQNRNYNLVGILLSKGVDPDFRDGEKRTPLSYAASIGSERMVDLLLSEGVDLDIKDSNSWTPLFYAVQNGHEHVVELLLSEGADPDFWDAEKRTPLSYAASIGSERMVDLLLSKGVDLDIKDGSNWTPLFYAAQNGHEKVVELLLSKGADPDFKDVHGLTPLAIAISNKYEGIVNLMRAKIIVGYG